MLFRSHGEKEAVERLVRYADNGDVAAGLQLGSMYYNGRGVLRDVNDAFGWFTKAAERNEAEAIFALARMAERGEGRERSVPDAVAGYQRASALGHLPATYNLARLYRLGSGIGANAASMNPPQMRAG